MELQLELAEKIYRVRVSSVVPEDQMKDVAIDLEEALQAISGVSDAMVAPDHNCNVTDYFGNPFICVTVTIGDKEDTDCTHEKVRQAIRTHLSIPG